MAKSGVTLTDEMLQSQARRILYESDDAWNQTAADNPEWLDLFKKAHGLDFIPTQVGGQGTQIPDDLETYGDLGLRIPFAVQLKAYNERLEADQAESDLATSRAFMDDEKKREEMRILYRTLAREGVLHDANGKCKHTECDINLLEVSDCFGGQKATYRWCNYDIPPEKAEKLATLAAKGSKAQIHELAGDPWPSDAISHGMTSLQQIDSGIAAHHRRQSFMAACQAGDTGLVQPTKKPYLQRHRYELPRDRAQRFATTTGAWPDSGMMPLPEQTMPPGIERQDRTTTGAMMEFLGGNMGATLPFSDDLMTSMIPLQQDLGEWPVTTTAEQDAAMLDSLIAETTRAQAEAAITADMFPISTTESDIPTSSAMRDFNLENMDLNFDSVFDMPMDESDGSLGVW